MIFLEKDDAWPMNGREPVSTLGVVERARAEFIRQTGLEPSALVVSFLLFERLRDSLQYSVGFRAVSRAEDCTTLQYRGLRMLRSTDVQLAIF